MLCLGIFDWLNEAKQQRTGVAVLVLRRSQFSGMRPRLNDSDIKRLPNTSIYN